MSQKWDDSVRGQLNNLASFPAKKEWELGDWIEECHVRPEVADFSSLPLTDNQLGDARIVLADQAWYIWNGSAWQSMGGGGGGGVNNVTASSPLSSSGGINPNISLAGEISVTNGGTGASSFPVGAVLFGNGAAPINTDSGHLFWDNVNDRLGVGNGAPAETLSVGTSSEFRVDDTGNITRIHDVPYNWPNVPGGADTFLRNDGSGNLTWQIAPSAPVTSVSGAGGGTGLTLSGGPTGAVTLTLGGTLAIANGGTGATNQTDAFDALSPTTTKGDLIAHNGSDNVRVPVGSNGNVLVANSTDAEGVVWGQVNLASAAAVTGTLPASNGGTGRSTLTVNNVVVGDGTNQVKLIAPGAIGDVLTWNGATWLSAPPTGGGGGVTTVTASAPILSSGGAFPDISLTAGTNTNDVLTWNGSAWVSSPPSGGGVATVTASAPLASSGGANPDISLTGIVGVANGGTGASSLTPNNVILGNGTSAVQTVAPGTSGNVLTSNGTTWQSTALPAAPVTSVSGASGGTGLTLSGGPTGAVTLTLGGTLLAANGGTGQSTYNVGDLLVGGLSNTLNKLSDVATGSALISGGVNVAPTWGKIGLTTHVSGTLPIANGGTGQGSTPSNGQILIGNGSGFSLNTITGAGTVTVTNTPGGITITGSGGGSTSPAGNNTEVQFNNGGVFGASSNLTFASNTLSVPIVQATRLKTADSGSGTATTLTVQPGSSAGSPLVGATLALEGGQNLGLSGTGGDVTIKAGFRGLAGNNLGAVTVQGGTVSVESTGALSLGTSNTTSVSIGRSGITTTITGGLTQTTGAFSLTGNNNSTLSTSAGNLTLTSAGLLSFTASGAVQISGSATSSFSTSAGNLTLSTTGGAATGVFISNNGTSGVVITASAGPLAFSGRGGTVSLTAASSPFVINNTSTDADFIVFGTTDFQLFCVDAGANRVGIGTNAPSAKLTINGSADQTGVGTNNTIFGVSAGANRTTASNFTAFGHQAGRAPSTPADNTAFGYQALGGSTALTGGSNTAVGSLALSTLQGTGANNTAIGRGAMSAATSASSNTAVGFSALDAITTAQSNTAVGLNAIGAATSGDSNTAVGSAALFNVSTGGNNTAVGAAALGASSGLTGSGNVAVGNTALGSLTSSSGSNVAFGAGAGSSVTSGVGAVLIGNNAANAATSINNEIVIGASAVARGVSNSITLGSGISSFRFNGFDPSSPTAGGFGINNITSNPVLRSSHTSVLSGTAFYGFYVGTTLYGSITQGGSTNVVYNTTSDYRLKENVEPIPDPLTRLAQLKPSRYNFIGNANKMEGFLAHELQEVVPYAVTGQKDAVDEGGKPVYQGVDQGYVVPLLTAAVQKLMEQVEALKAEIAALKT